MINKTILNPHKKIDSKAIYNKFYKIKIKIKKLLSKIIVKVYKI